MPVSKVIRVYRQKYRQNRRAAMGCYRHKKNRKPRFAGFVVYLGFLGT
jgi:hypothetical protein